MENKFYSEKYIELVIPKILLSEYDTQGGVTNINARHSIVHVPIDRIDFCGLSEFSYSYFPACYAPQSTINLEQTGVRKVQDNPNFSLFGAGVLIGIIDTGINYRHDAFLYKDETTKIYSIWDQTVENNEDAVNEEFPYGSFYSKKRINEALSSNNPLDIVPTNDEVGHGTAMAGIAVGTPDIENDFQGIAPLSELVVVKLKQAKQVTRQFFSISENAVCYEKSDIMMGIKYVMSVAQELNRPMVVCMMLGSSQGGDDGLGPLSYYLNDITRTPRLCAVVSCGDEGNSKRHYLGLLKKEEEYKEFDINVGKEDQRFFIEIWMQPIQRLSIEITSPTGEKVSNVNPGIKQLKKYNFIFGPTRVCINNITAESESGDQLILIRFEFTQPGIWKIRLNNIDNTTSEFNAWLPSGDMISQGTYFTQSDPYITITAPGTALAPITTTSYNMLDGGISIFSSKGFTRKEVIKPDLAAPGNDITAPSNKDGYILVSGTGAAAATVAGISALLLEWAVLRGNYTGISGVELKTFLIRGAKRDLYLDYPNRTWGYGKVDLYGAFEKITL